MSTMTTRTVVEAFLAAVEARDPGRLGPLLSEDLRYFVPTSLPAGGVFTGAAAFIAMIGYIDQVYRPETMVYDREPLLVDGARAACRFELSAVTVGGAPYRNRYALFARVEDGLICEIEEYLDTGYLSRVAFGG